MCAAVIYSVVVPEGGALETIQGYILFSKNIKY